MSNTTIVGTTGPDTLSGGTGNDTIWGDTNTGFATSDTVTVGAGDSISAGDGNDLVYGQAGNDTIDGGAGNDTLFGGVGDDSIVGGAGDDSIDGGAGNDTLSGGAGIDTLSYASATGGVEVDLRVNSWRATGGAGHDSINTVSENRFEVVVGSDYADTVYVDSLGLTVAAGAGNDVIRSGRGADFIDGGTGFDTIEFGGTTAGVSIDLNNAVQAGGDAQGDTLVSIEAVYGSSYDDTLTGNAGGNWLFGNLGNDIVDGGAGDDTLLGGTGNDSIDGNAGNDSIDGGSGDDTLSGGAGDDTLLGGTGNDSIDGNAGNDSIDGGGDDDTLSGGAGDDTLSGGTGNDNIAGSAGNDSIDGGAGNDTLSGGTGIDTLSYLSATAAVTVDLNSNTVTGGAGNDSIVASGSTDTLGDRFEVLVGSSYDDQIKGSGSADTLLGGSGNDTLFGDVGNDNIAGGAGNDSIDGGAGNDTLSGGTGTDTLSYLDATTGVYIDLNYDYIARVGTDTDVIDSIPGNAFEVLQGSAFNDTILVGPGNDSFFGNAGNDVLFSDTGSHYLDGGTGYDTVNYNNLDNGFSANLADGVASNGDTLIGIEALLGGRGNDTLIGNDNSNFFLDLAGNNVIQAGGGNDTLSSRNGDDLLDGGAGDDSLFAGTGADTLIGGAGNDTLFGGVNGGTQLQLGDWADYTGATAGVTVSLDSLGSGTATGGAGDDVLISMENVRGGAGDDSIVGTGSLDNLFDGSLGNDTLAGGAGNDTLIGGTGNDWADYSSATAGVTVSLGSAGSGTATGGAGNDTLSGIENVLGSAGNDSIFVSQDASQGGVIDGGAGNDYVKWNDVAADTAPATGISTLLGGSGTDTLELLDWTGPYAAGTDTLADGIYGAWQVGTDAASGMRTFINSSVTTTLNAAQFEAVVCFASGTMIATARGEVAVEDLRAGDLVVTAGRGAGLQPVQWIGRTTARVARHPDRAKVAPVLVKAGALGRGVPFRDLRVSPDHALFLDGHLVPAKYLVNGISIIQEMWCPEVTYWHVEMPSHTLLVSDGALTESYLDDGNRRHFDNGAIASLFPDFESERANGRYDRDACHPVLRGGEKLEAIRQRIAAIAAAPDTAKTRRRA